MIEGRRWSDSRGRKGEEQEKEIGYPWSSPLCFSCLWSWLFGFMRLLTEILNQRRGLSFAGWLAVVRDPACFSRLSLLWRNDCVLMLTCLELYRYLRIFGQGFQSNQASLMSRLLLKIAKFLIRTFFLHSGSKALSLTSSLRTVISTAPQRHEADSHFDSINFTNPLLKSKVFPLPWRADIVTVRWYAFGSFWVCGDAVEIFVVLKNKQI